MKPMKWIKLVVLVSLVVAATGCGRPYAVATPEWRARNLGWFEAVEALVGKVMMPSGLIERQVNRKRGVDITGWLDRRGG